MELNAVLNTIGDVYCPECELQKCIFEHYCKEDSRELYHFNCPKCDADCLVQGIPFEDQTQMTLLKDADTYTFRAKTTRLRARTKRTSRKRQRNGIPTTIPEKKDNQSTLRRTTSKKDQVHVGKWTCQVPIACSISLQSHFSSN